VGPAARRDPGSARTCAVHLQFRGLEHERDDHQLSHAVFLRTERHYDAIKTGVIFTAATLGVLVSALPA